MSGWLELLSLEALLFTISIAFILLAMAKERTEYRHRAAARTDPLTGIANRRGFLEQTAVSRRAGGRHQPTAVLLFDLDHFKTINDQYGHAVGDRTLQIFADTAKAHVGAAGTVGRWGGDEFVAVLYNTSREIAATVAERIQLALREGGRRHRRPPRRRDGQHRHGVQQPRRVRTAGACCCRPTRRSIAPRPRAATASPSRRRKPRC